jgi:alcohol dehydrogenase
VSDILPTAYEVGVRNGQVEPGDTVVIVGAGPVGLAAVITARLYSPSTIIVIDKAATRLQAAKDLGAHIVAGPDGKRPRTRPDSHRWTLRGWWRWKPSEHPPPS